MNNQSNILVADDDPLIRKMMQRVLTDAGYEVYLAQDGKEAIQQARVQQPDLILLDVNMPDMNGFETLRHLKADPQLASIYVMIISGVQIDSNSQAHGLEMGADGYLLRPIANRELVARVQAMMRIKAAEDALRRKEAQLREIWRPFSWSQRPLPHPFCQPVVNGNGRFPPAFLHHHIMPRLWHNNIISPIVPG